MSQTTSMSKSHGWVAMALLTVPYVLSKFVVATNTAFEEWAFGEIGTLSLQSESVSMHFMFLIFGTVMNGLRATSIITASKVEALRRGEQQDPTTASQSEDQGLLMPEDKERPMHQGLLSKLFRGRLALCKPHQDEGSAAATASDDLPTSSAVISSITLMFGIAAMLFLWGAALFVLPRPSDQVLREVRTFGWTTAIGGIATLSMYNKEQLLLAAGATGIPLLYSFVYNGVAAVLLWQWYQEMGLEAIGLSLSIGAWVAYLLLKLHLYCDPVLRAHQLSTERWIWHRVRAGGRGTSLTDRFPPRSVVWNLCKEFLTLGVPLGLAGCVELARMIVVSSMITSCSSSDGQILSIAQAYYDVLTIGMLGASSVISAVVAMEGAGAASSEEDGGRTSIQGPEFGEGGDQHDATRPRCWQQLRGCRATHKTVALVWTMGGLLGCLMVIIPTSFANFFGRSIERDTMTVADASQWEHSLHQYVWVTFVGYLLTMSSMTLGAMLHGMRVVWKTLIVMVVSNGLAMVWAAVWYGVQGCDGALYAQASGIVANALSMLGCVALIFLSNVPAGYLSHP